MSTGLPAPAADGTGKKGDDRGVGSLPRSSPRVICCFSGSSGLHPWCKSSLGKCGREVEFVDVSGSPTAYYDALAGAWSDGVDAVFVEQDVVVCGATFARLDACASLLCREGPHFHCWRARAELMEKVPDAFELLPLLDRGWTTLDSRFEQSIASLGYRFHEHHPWTTIHAGAGGPANMAGWTNRRQWMGAHPEYIRANPHAADPADPRTLRWVRRPKTNAEAEMERARDRMRRALPPHDDGWDDEPGIAPDWVARIFEPGPPPVPYVPDDRPGAIRNPYDAARREYLARRAAAPPDPVAPRR